MRNLVFLGFLASVAFLVVGWYLDWYSIAGVQNSSGKHRVQIDINSGKIKQDLNKGTAKFNDTVKKVQDGGDPKPLQDVVKDNVKDTVNQVKESVKDTKQAVTNSIQPTKGDKSPFAAPRF